MDIDSLACHASIDSTLTVLAKLLLTLFFSFVLYPFCVCGLRRRRNVVMHHQPY